MNSGGVVVTIMLLAGLACVAASSAASPPELNAVQVTAVRITAIYPTIRESTQVVEVKAVQAIAHSSAFSPRPWQASDGRELVPEYRLEFLSDDTVEATYYLGTNSNPPRFPCYSFCSGWWLGVAGVDGSLDRTRYLGLSENVYVPLVKDLGLP